MRQNLVIAVVCAALGASAAGCRWWGDERAVIRERLESFTEKVNAGAPDGLASVARVAEIMSYFTDDVVVELGEGSPPITGKETLTGMAMRLQTRLAAFTLAFVDVTVQLSPGASTADVTLTAEFIRRQPTGRQSMDAREFKLGMQKIGEEWKIARVTAVDTLK